MKPRLSNLINRFIIVGSLDEIKVTLYETYITAKFTLLTENNNTIFLVAFFSKSVKREYEAFVGMLSRLYPRVVGYVYCDNMRYYTFKARKTPTKLFCSGNIRTSKNNVFFNAETIRIADNESDMFNIKLQGIWADEHRFLTITKNSPQVFTIDKPKDMPENEIINAELRYLSGVSYQDEDIVTATDDDYPLEIIRCVSTKKKVQESEIADYILEWEIMTEG